MKGNTNNVRKDSNTRSRGCGERSDESARAINNDAGDNARVHSNRAQKVVGVIN
jgi:hypothetical protein